MIDQDYFGVISQRSIFFVASMEAKNQLDTSYSLSFLSLKHLTV